MKSTLMAPAVRRLILPLLTLVSLMLTLSLMGQSKEIEKMETSTEAQEALTVWDSDEVPKLLEEELPLASAENSTSVLPIAETLLPEKISKNVTEFAENHNSSMVAEDAHQSSKDDTKENRMTTTSSEMMDPAKAEKESPEKDMNKVEKDGEPVIDKVVDPSEELSTKVTDESNSEADMEVAIPANATADMAKTDVPDHATIQNVDNSTAEIPDHPASQKVANSTTEIPDHPASQKVDNSTAEIPDHPASQNVANSTAEIAKSEIPDHTPSQNVDLTAQHEAPKNSSSVDPSFDSSNPSVDVTDVQDKDETWDFDSLVTRYVLKRNQAPPPRFDLWFKFAKGKKCYLDRYDSLYRDLAPFIGMSAQEFKHRLELAKKAPRIHSLKIKNGRVVSGLNHPMVASFAEFLPDMDIVINGLDEPRILFDTFKSQSVPPLPNDGASSSPWFTPPRGSHAKFLKDHDCLVYSQNRPFEVLNDKHGFLIEPDTRSYSTHLLPMLSQTRVDPCFADILVPSLYYMGAAKKGAEGKKHPWESREPNVFWRGKTTGGHAIARNYKNFHRQRLMALKSKNETLFDFSFVATTQCEKDDCESMTKEYPFAKGRSSFQENFKHKYLVDIDGNTFSGRFLAFLYSGSLVFKPTAFTEFFRDWLKPYVHYIPVEMDLSDLEAKVQWALEHDSEAKEIALNGQKFAEEHLHEGQMHCYTFLLLLEIARLMGIE